MEKFEIPLFSLKNGKSNFEFELSNRSFEKFPHKDFQEGQVKVIVDVQKDETIYRINFSILGKLMLECDRCLNTFPSEIWEEFKLVLKCVTNPVELNESETDSEIYYIHRTQGYLDIRNWIYEFITLSLPIQKKCNNVGKNDYCNQEVLKKLQKHIL